MDQIKVIYGSTKAIWLSKIALRGVSSLLCIIMIGIAGHLATGAGRYSPSYGDFVPLAIVGAQSCVAVVWDVAESLCLIFRRGHRGAHPGACVGMDLILWLGFILGAVFIDLVCWADTCGYYSYYDDRSDGRPSTTFRNAFIALNSLLVIVHFTLFVIACWETSIRNRALRIVIDKNNPEMNANSQQLFNAYQAQLQARGILPPAHAMKGYQPPVGQGYVEQPVQAYGQPFHGQAYGQPQPASAPGTVVSEPSQMGGHAQQHPVPSPMTTPPQA